MGKVSWKGKHAVWTHFAGGSFEPVKNPHRHGKRTARRALRRAWQRSLARANVDTDPARWRH